MLQTAIEAAKAAGAVLLNYFEMTDLEREEKDDKSFVTKADKETEAVIVDIIRRAHPDHGIVGEEGADVNSGAEFQWVIDPIDATRNFANGIPIFAISIAVVHAGEPIVGVLYNPVTESLYAAEKGKGMTVNGKSARVSTQAADAGMVTLGPGQKEKDRLFAIIANAEKHFRSVRYLGCTAIELAYVARGGTEAFICLGLKKWDYAAGRLLVTEAGGTVTDFAGNPCDIEQNYFVATNGVAHGAALALVNSVPAN